MGVHTVVSTVGDLVVLEDGTSYPLSSEKARQRLHSDLFYSYDPLVIAASNDLVLHRSGRTVRGSGGCKGKPLCSVSLDLHLDEQGRPYLAKATFHRDGTVDTVKFFYSY